MQLSVRRKLRRLPKRFPVGTTYVVEGHVVEGHGGAGDDSDAGRLQVFSRYVVLPSGQRINLVTNLGANPGSPALPSSRRIALLESKVRAVARQSAGRPDKTKENAGKKIMARGGTSPRDRR